LEPRPKTAEKYGELAAGYAERTYADPVRFFGRRAELVEHLGTPLEPGDRIVDLACADAGIGPVLRARGLTYVGVDASPQMVEAARRRLGDPAAVQLADMNTYLPPRPVQAVLCFNAVYYADDRGAFLRRVAEYTEKKLVFDLNPRRFRLTEIRADIRAAGFDSLALRPFFVPQRYALPAPAAHLLQSAERLAPLARALLSVRFTYVCAAYRDTSGRPSSKER
jgi:hypothetical protein